MALDVVVVMVIRLAQVVVEPLMILVGPLVLSALMAPLFLVARESQVVFTVLMAMRFLMVLAVLVAQAEPATLPVVVA